MVQTNYGKLAIVEDRTTGHFRMAGGEGVSGSTSAPATPKEPVRGRQTPPTDEFDSKLEALRHRHLSMLVLAGEVRRFRYHAFSVLIGPGKKYTPDFLVEYADGRIVIEEVKGSLKMKNARDSITRLHVAAGLLPMFGWRVVLGAAMEERDVTG